MPGEHQLEDGLMQPEAMKAGGEVVRPTLGKPHGWVPASGRNAHAQTPGHLLRAQTALPMETLGWLLPLTSRGSVGLGTKGEVGIWLLPSHDLDSL